ncbi:MAG: TonB-dependent receptor [Stenotrophomonas sp.]|uniref:TonB-dependent receptor n=1 Tax=Stenotrophomonas TaxID=40323 RepID=UPI000C32D019|nr:MULTISPECIES: TonB-dependent receptor [unclassified Stenotrophomonas]MDX3931685.1 TonB-dependent receptor [Stenotrophomonas sp.]PKH73085.1 energy transducer TonB [Stenotrophomonas sp. Betaine-02u-23]PKH75953.1 energy transducer TonB [Stenotrophomonas sp. Betaine-02u-21]PKH97278.1 energy transducer TonB [Stenotrophomonas sp. Bg11-02]
MKAISIKRAALTVALGACLGMIVPSVATAQNVSGAVAGRATAGDLVTVVNRGTGLTRSATAGSDGSYRLGQLPVGDYTLQLSRDGAALGEPVSVSVAVGGTTTVNLASGGGVVNLDALQVVGSRVINRVDVYSTETSFNVNRQEISRLPVAQDLSAVALLAPGVVGGNSSFGGLSFAGSSVAENAVYINGLNVTDMYTRRGFSSAPFGFFQEFQVKTGGYSVEFGRSTGGVINAVTRSGSNEFEGGAEVTFEPNAWRSAARDHFHRDGSPHSYASTDATSFTKTNVWGSGALVKDKLFLFAMYEKRDTDGNNTSSDGRTWFDNTGDDDFWGAKLDWNITDNHTLELLAFSDETETTQASSGYNWDTQTLGQWGGDTLTDGGGKNWSATYTGRFGESFTAKAMVGQNNQRAFSNSTLDLYCDAVFTDATYAPYLGQLNGLRAGCHPTGTAIAERDDTRDAARLDFEWALGRHLLRFGVDRELMTTDQSTRYPGPSQMTYTAYAARPGDEVWDGANAYVPAGVNQMLRARNRVSGGNFETEANAFYLEDIWNITSTLMLNLGVRWDRFENRTADGDAFIKMDDLIAPRVGFAWDIKGDGSTKLFGNAGRYYLPVTNNINVNFAGGLTDEYSYYVLNGWQQQSNPVTGAPYMAPVIGQQVGPTDTRMNTGAADLRQSVDKDLKAVYQDEYILGFQTMINQAWSWGVNGTYRRMTRALDDMRLNHTPCGPTGSTLWPIANPGESLTIWGDSSIGCAEEGWITIDTANSGYRKGGSGEVVGYSKPKRTYKALEFQLDRAWDEKWMFNASYLWSKSEGNFEGPVNSDTNYGDTGMVQHWDHPSNNERYGALFNDFRHQFKFRAAYALNEQWSFGSTLQVQSGGPVTAFGVMWPGDTVAGGSTSSEGSGGGTGWLCVANCTGTYDQRVFEPTARGAFGNLPWTWTMGANVTWRLPVDGIDLSARLSVYNLFNNQTVINVHQRYESQPGVYREATFKTGTRWQAPRYAQLVVAWNF